MVLGVLIGGLMGFAWTGMEQTMPRTGSVDDFKLRLGQIGESDATKDMPRIKNIRVLAAETDPNGKLVTPVTFDRLGTDKAGKAVYQTQSIYAKEQFDGNKTIVQYLDDKKASYLNMGGPLKFLPVGYGVAGGIIGIGLIWPTMIRLLIGAGLTQPKEPKVEEKTYATGDQDDGTDKPKKRFGFALGGGEKTPDPFAAKPLTDATSDDDVSKLFTSTGKGAKEQTAATAAPATEQEKKDYAGAYYPVARPATPKKD